MLTVAAVAKAWGGQELFRELTLQINRGDRIGLVGPNGAGKSTLFRIILGEEEVDEGGVTFQRGVRVGFLPQESAPVGEETVLEIATGAGLEGRLAEEMERANRATGAEWVVGAGDGAAQAKAKRLLKGFAFRESDFDRPARTLSGGWVMRAHLARLLVAEPDLLMLDEPTNHLDLETLLWFQEYLTGYPGAILVISHDREFLNRLVTSIAELRQGRLYRYRGNYDTFLEQRAAVEEQQWAAFKNQQREIDRLMLFVNRFRAKSSKAAQAQAKLKQIERMEKLQAPEGSQATVDFAFPQPEQSGRRVIRLRGVRHAYGDVTVYDGLEFEVERGEHVVLVGPNGAGKSTLLKLLAGVLPVQVGERELGLRVKAGYFSQYRAEVLQMGRTVLEEAMDTPARVTELYVRSVLGCFLFRDDDVFKRVGVLSGGEKSRLALVKLLLDPPNLLLMDEPTTHLDMASIDALIAALSEYTGTLVFISHDVHFIRSIADRVVHVNAGRLTRYAGDYEYYLERTNAGSARAALTAGGVGGVESAGRLGNFQPGAADDRGGDGGEAKERRLTQKERRQQAAEARRALSAQKRLVAGLEAAIGGCEEKIAALAAELEKPETHRDSQRVLAINRDLLAQQSELELKTGEWEAAATRLTEMESATTANDASGSGEEDGEGLEG